MPRMEIKAPKSGLSPYALMDQAICHAEPKIEKMIAPIAVHACDAD